MTFSLDGNYSIATGSDVAISNPLDGHSLVYDDSLDKWKNATPVVATTVELSSHTSSYALVLADAGKVVEVTSSSAAVVTVPASESIDFPVGTVIEIAQTGTGQITLAPDPGVTLQSPASLVSRTQWSTLGLRKRTTDEWIISGDLA